VSMADPTPLPSPASPAAPVRCRSRPMRSRARSLPCRDARRGRWLRRPGGRLGRGGLRGGAPRGAVSWRKGKRKLGEGGFAVGVAGLADYGDELVGVERCAADERAVYVGLGDELGDVIGADAAAILDANFVGDDIAVEGAHKPAY